MRNVTKVAVAVAAALGAGTAMAATNPNYTLSLNVAGSSAMRDAVLNEFSNVLCATGTVNGPFVSAKESPGIESPDFRALTCTLGSKAGTQSGTVVAVYYRSEGGSIFGIFGSPFLNGGTQVKINRLNIGPAGGTQPTSFGIQESVAQLVSDTQVSNEGAITKDTVDLGVSDVEPWALIGENSGSEYYQANGGFIPFAAPSFSKLLSVPNFGNVIGEVYAPIVSNSGGSAYLTNATGFNNTAGLTSQELATIFSGAASDWSQIPSAVAGGTAGGRITVCRRDAGSGTQTVTSTHFLGTNCSSGGLPFVAATTSTGPVVVTNFATADVLSCVGTNAGAIGLVTLQPAAKYTGAPATQVTVDGIPASAVNSAQDKYTWYGEAYFINMQVGGAKATLIAKVVSDLSSANNVPPLASDPNLVAIPSATNAPVTPVPTTYPTGSGQQIPIAVGTTGGNVCSPLINQL